MTGNDILVYMTDVNEKYICEAEGAVSMKVKPSANKLILIAAIIAAMAVLLGCGIALSWYAKEMSIAEETVSIRYFDENEVLVDEDVTADVLTLHGIQGSPAYLAAQEWYAFTESYDPDGVLYLSALKTPMDVPEEYEAYSVYTQEMMDKVDEITDKYDLQLLGAFAPFQRNESEVFYEAVGLDSILNPESEAKISRESGYFFEGGNFKVSFNMEMPEGDGYWPYPMVNELYYSKAENFDTITLPIALENWNQWSYTTSSGAEVLVLWHKDGGGSPRVYYNREDAMIYMSIQAYYQIDSGELIMTEDQLKQVIDQLDFSLMVHDVDMELAKEKLEKFQNP